MNCRDITLSCMICPYSVSLCHMIITVWHYKTYKTMETYSFVTKLGAIITKALTMYSALRLYKGTSLVAWGPNVDKYIMPPVVIIWLICMFVNLTQRYHAHYSSELVTPVLDMSITIYNTNMFTYKYCLLYPYKSLVNINSSHFGNTLKITLKLSYVNFMVVCLF
jgi:hypothetical protein